MLKLTCIVVAFCLLTGCSSTQPKKVESNPEKTSDWSNIMATQEPHSSNDPSRKIYGSQFKN